MVEFNPFNYEKETFILLLAALIMITRISLQKNYSAPMDFRSKQYLELISKSRTDGFLHFKAEEWRNER